MRMAKPSPKPRSARAPYSHKISGAVFIAVDVRAGVSQDMSHLRDGARQRLAARSYRAVAESPDVVHLTCKARAFKQQTRYRVHLPRHRKNCYGLPARDRKNPGSSGGLAM